MKKSAKIIIFILSVLTASLAQSMVSGPIIREDASGTGRIDRQRYFWGADSVVYAAGGVTFIYPVGMFTAAPFVVVQIEERRDETAFIVLTNGTIIHTRDKFEDIMSLAPSALRLYTKASPIPLDAPVIQTTLFFICV